MGKNVIKVNCSREQFGKTFKHTVTNCKIAGSNFGIKEHKNGFILKPQISLQKKTIIIKCKFEIASLKNNVIEVKVTYTLTVYPIIFLILFLYILYAERVEIISNFDFGSALVVFLFIAVWTFFYFQEKNACQSFLEYLLNELKDRYSISGYIEWPKKTNL